MRLAALAKLRLGAAARSVSTASAGSGRERIHALRVYLRRAQPFIALARPDSPAGLRDWLGAARRAERLLSPVRNCDEAAALARTWKGIDREAVRHFVRAQNKLRRRRLREALDGFGRRDRRAWAAAARSLDRALRTIDAASFLSRSAAEKRKRLSLAVRACAGLRIDSSADDWHEARRDFRLFRYAVEDERTLGLSPTPLERSALSIQRTLGRSNDLAVLAKRVAKLRARLPSGSPLHAGLSRLEREARARRRRLLAGAVTALSRLGA
jgi:CHAD domain-containing protein